GAEPRFPTLRRAISARCCTSTTSPTGRRAEKRAHGGVASYWEFTFHSHRCGAIKFHELISIFTRPIACYWCVTRIADFVLLRSNMLLVRNQKLAFHVTPA